MKDIEIANYGVFLEKDGAELPICLTSDYFEAKNFYEGQVSNWINSYKDKEIDNNDRLIFKNIKEDFTIRSCSLFDLI